MKISQLTGLIALSAVTGTVSAQLISPLTGVDYSTYGISAEGGVVIDIVGTSGVQIVSQIAAADMFFGYYDSVVNDFFATFGVPPLVGAGPDAFIPDSTMGIRAGYTPSLVAALGGGISSMSIRLTEYDGDTGSAPLAPGVNVFNPDLDPLAAGIDLLINGENVANFEDVGFESDSLDTGFFTISDAGALAAIFADLSASGEVVLGYDEGDDKGLAFVDFTTGLDPDAMMNGVRPVSTEVIPEPSVLGLLGFASILGFLAVRRRR